MDTDRLAELVTQKREILIQLNQAKTLLAEEVSGDSQSESYQKINLCYANLFRMWADAS